MNSYKLKVGAPTIKNMYEVYFSSERLTYYEYSNAILFIWQNGFALGSFERYSKGIVNENGA